jgi:hypothetical protein
MGGDSFASLDYFKSLPVREWLELYEVYQEILEERAQAQEEYRAELLRMYGGY